MAQACGSFKPTSSRRPPEPFQVQYHDLIHLQGTDVFRSPFRHRPFFPPLLIQTLLLQPAYHGSMVSKQTLPSSCHPEVLQGASSRRLKPSLRARTCIDVNTHDVISSLFDESSLSLSFTHRLDGLSSCFECIIPASVPTVALIEQSSRPLN